MLTLIKFIHILNSRITSITSSHSQRTPRTSRSQWAATRFQSVCAIIALSCVGIGNIATVGANSIDRVGIGQSLTLTTDLRSTPKTLALDSGKQQLGTNSRNQSNASIAQNTPATPTPTNSNNGSSGKLQNNLNLPKTAPEVQINNSKSLTLKNALDIALQNNRDVQAARLTVTKSQAVVREAQAAQAVQVGLTGSLANQGNPVIFGNSGSTVSSSSTDVQGKLQATYNLLNAGRDASSVRAAEEQVNFDRLDLLRIEQTTRGNVLTAYYDLQDADSSVIINQAAVRDAARSLSDAQLQERAGVGTKFDILRAQVQLATANQNLTSSQGQQQTARKRIAQLLSVDQNTEFTAADAVRELGNWSYSLEDSVVLAYKNRPEVKQQLVRRRINQQQEIVASAADSAQLSLFSNYTLAKSLNSSLGSTGAQDSYSIGAQVSWSFWDGGAAGARSYQQRVSQEIAENQFTTARNQIRFEVEQAYNNLGTNKKNIITATQALKQADESLKLARLRFQAGVGTQTDVIQAQTDLARARGNRITAIINYNRSLSSLQTATLTDR